MVIQLLGLLTLGIPFALVILPKWRWLILTVMVWMVYEGAFRKWILPAYQGPIYLLKDAILLLAYVGFVLFPPKFRKVPQVFRIIQIFTTLCVAYFAICLFNPNSPSVLLSFLGFKNYVFYFPLMFIVPYIVTEETQLYLLLKIYFCLVLPAIIISYIQVSLSPNHWLNGYVAQEAGIETFVSQFGAGTGRARTAGTFSFLSGNVTFLVFIVVLSFSILVGRRFEWRGNVLTYCVLFTATGAMFSTGSRIGVLSMLIAPVLILCCASLRRNLNIGAFMRVSVGLTAAVFFISKFASTAFDAFDARLGAVSDTSSRFMAPFTQTLTGFQEAPLLGTGLASTHGGLVNMLIPPGHGYYWLYGVRLELESARVILETGLAGFVFFFGLKVSVLVVSLRLSFLFKSHIFSSFAAGCATWSGLHIILHLASNPTAALYYYFAVGFLGALWSIENNHLSRIHAKL